jgi:Megaviricetes DNA primase
MSDNNEMVDDLKAFLRKTRIKRDVNSANVVRHTGNYVTKPSADFHEGSYYVSNDNKSNFFKLVCDSVYAGNILTVAEKSTTYGPLRVDFDFKAPLRVGLKRQYTEKILKSIVGLYQQEITKILAKNEYSPDVLTCMVLEKESPREENGEIKDGFHFHFPKFICDARIQDYYLRDKVTELMVKNQVWKGCTLNTEIEKIIDERMWKKPWMLYGSANVKDERSTPYMYNRRQSDISKENNTFEERSILASSENAKSRAGHDPWEDVQVDKQWGHAYNHKLKEIPIAKVFESEMEGLKLDVRYNLPLLMSIRGEEVCTSLDPAVEATLAHKGLHKKKYVASGDAPCPRVRSNEEIAADHATIIDGKLMDMLSVKRADNYDTWMDVGWILFNIFNGQEEGLNYWREFSMKSENFEEGECERQWMSMTVRGRTIEALKSICRKDDPAAFNKWHRRSVDTLIKESLKPPKPNEYDVSNVVKAKQAGRFKCVNPKHKGEAWMQFRDHRWREMPGELALRRFIVEDVIAEYMGYNYATAKKMRENSKKLQDIDDESPGDQDAINTEDANNMKATKKLMDIIGKIKTESFQNAIIKQCKLHMSDELFLEKMDENRKLLCCENGVLDLDLGTFRDGRPDDYCTMSTKVAYTDLGDTNENVIYLRDLLSKTFVNENIRNFTLDVVCSCLEGGNVHKIVIMFTGAGDGGKSVFIKLLEHTLGDYFGKFPRETFIVGAPTSAGGPRSDLDQMSGKRIMSTQELSATERFNIGFLKEISGDDSIYTRGAYKPNGRTITPQCTCILQFNKGPKLEGDDPAWDRVRSIPCESKFVRPHLLAKYPVPDDENEQRKMTRFHADIRLKDNIPKLAPAMLWILFNHYVKIYKKNGSKLRHCKEVEIATDTYRNENDIYQQFYKACVKKIKDEDKAKVSYITNNQIYNKFQVWCSDNYPTHLKSRHINKPKIMDEIDKKLGIRKTAEDIYGLEKNKYWGYNLREEEKEENNNEDG